MHPKAIDAIRDLALTFENENLQVAYDLMGIAYKNRPNGQFIKNKFLEYKQKVENPAQSLENELLLSLLKTGEVVIIPIGFRCHTKMLIASKLGFKQASFPFDSGFFSPHSVASVFNNPRVSLSYNDKGSHAVCIKNENHQDLERGKGIKFESSTYERINSITVSKELPNITNYLDSTFGYYTLDKKHKFILAHYNWHSLSSDSRSNGIKDPKDNIPLINELMNKRIDRMLESCSKAQHVFFLFLNKNADYLKIDDDYYDLTDFSEFESVLNEKYKFQYSILNLEQISSKDMLNIIDLSIS